jgi:hypothetical protein
MVNRLLSCKINKAFKPQIKNTAILSNILDSSILSSNEESAESEKWDGFASKKKNTILQITMVMLKIITDNEGVGFIRLFIDIFIFCSAGILVLNTHIFP